MGSLALHAQQIGEKKDSIIEVLVHFDQILKEGSAELNKVSAAADAAFTDDLLYEKILHWIDDHDDEVLLFHINSYFENRHLKRLSGSSRDLTAEREKIEGTVRESVSEKQKRIFSERITRLALDFNLNTNEALGEFLGVSSEQARRFKTGEHKPQLGTLKKIADKFNVKVEYLVGLSDSR